MEELNLIFVVGCSQLIVKCLKLGQLNQRPEWISISIGENSRLVGKLFPLHKQMAARFVYANDKLNMLKIYVLGMSQGSRVKSHNLEVAESESVNQG